MSAASIVLEPVSASVPQARRFVADQLADLPTDDRRRRHAFWCRSSSRTPCCTPGPSCLSRSTAATPSVSIQVADANPLLPVVRTHSTDAGTGRGLRRARADGDRGGAVTTSKAARSSGSRSAPTRNPTPTSTPPQVSEDRSSEEPSSGSLRDPRLSRVSGEPNRPIEKPDDIVHFSWCGLPLVQLDLTAEHYDSVLREFHLVLEREPEARAAVPGRLIALMDELTMFGPLISSVEQDLDQGRLSGAAILDVGLELPREIGTFRAPPRQLLDETDAYCAAGVELLSLEPTSEVVALRKWLIGELVRQAEGHPAVPWQRKPVGDHADSTPSTQGLTGNPGSDGVRQLAATETRLASFS